MHSVLYTYWNIPICICKKGADMLTELNGVTDMLTELSGVAYMLWVA